MVKTIAITNQKGGVGKTTTAVNLTAILADMGQRVLVVDLDPQGNTTSGLGCEAGGKSVYEALMGRIPFRECLQQTMVKGLTLAGADIRLAGAAGAGGGRPAGVPVEGGLSAGSDGV